MEWMFMCVTLVLEMPGALKTVINLYWYHALIGLSSYLKVWEKSLHWLVNSKLSSASIFGGLTNVMKISEGSHIREKKANKYYS